MPKNAVSENSEIEYSDKNLVSHKDIMFHKPKMGRPATVIDYKLLEQLCKMQCTAEECASVFGIHFTNLNKRLLADGHGTFAKYFKLHSGSGKAALRRLQWREAEKGNTQMLMHLGKQYLGQSEKLDTTAQVQNNIKLDFSAFDDEAREYIRQALLAAEMKTIEGEVLDD